MSVERLRERLNAVEAPAGMSAAVSIKMNTIIREELTYARNENNIAQFAKLLEEYQEAWSNKPGLVELKVNLSGANLSGANLSGAYLRGADLSGADLSGANLSGANLSVANLSGAYLSEADLSGANLSGAYLIWAHLSGANLSGADLRGAYLRGAIVSRANLSGAIVIGVDFTGPKPATAIKAPKELLGAINSILDSLANGSITEEELNKVPTLYSAALEIGKNGAKKRSNGSVICGPQEGLLEISEKLKDLVLNTAVNKILQAFVVDKVSLTGGWMSDKLILEKILESRIDLISCFSAPSLKVKEGMGLSLAAEITKSLKNSKEKISSSVVTAAVGTATTTATSASTSATTTTAAASTTATKQDKKSKKDYTASKEKAPNNEIKNRIITAVQSGEKDIDGSMSVVIETTIGKKTHNSDRVKHVLEGLGVKISSECLTRDFKGKTGDKEESYHENAIKITLSADEVNIIKGKAPSPSKLQPSSLLPGQVVQREASGPS